MIRSIKGSATRQFVEQGKSRFSGMDVALAHRRLRQINTASNLQALAGLNSVGLHKLKGDKRDFWSVDVNGHDVSIGAYPFSLQGRRRL